jgi:WD40 repeat protein
MLLNSMTNIYRVLEDHVTCISWLPAESNFIVTGSAKGYLRCYDIRSGNEAPVLSVPAHTSFGSCKVNGIRVDAENQSPYIATFSDTAGDHVKIWVYSPHHSMIVLNSLR